MKVSDTLCRMLCVSRLIGCFMAITGLISGFIPTVAQAEETVILTVSLNTISHGELFIKRNSSGILLIKRDDLQHIGFKVSTVPVTIVDNEPYIALTSLTGVTAQLDESVLSLDLRAGAEWLDLPQVLRNFSPSPSPYSPSTTTSSFINYRLDHGAGNDTDVNVWSVTTQGGVRQGNLLLLSDGYYQHYLGSEQPVRLSTSLTWDRPATYSRWVAGDFIASAGEPSGPLSMGGLSFATAYSLIPNLTTYPLGTFGAVATLPSEADIFVNGILVRRERLTPGNYRFQNLPVINGINNVEIVMRDSFGNESRTGSHFYLSDRLLKAGFHDFSYNGGFMREAFGSTSNKYGAPVFLARHSFGINDTFTAGAGGEAGNGLVNLVPRVVIGLADSGVITGLFGVSNGQSRTAGATGGISYQFQSHRINYQARFAYTSSNYRTLESQLLTDTVRLDTGMGISMGTPSVGTISLNGAYTETYAGQLRRSLATAYTRSLTKKIQFSATLSSTWGSSNEILAFSGLTIFPAKDMTASALVQTASGSNSESLSLQKSLPTGNGVGYMGTLTHEQTPSQSMVRINPLLQLQGPYGSYSADLREQFDDHTGRMDGNYQVSAAGAIIAAGGKIGFSRPVSSSFALVHIEGLADTAVLLNNQEFARTNSQGMAYIPTLQPYQENKISFNDRDIPPNYLIKRYTTVVTPGLFGGECIYFPVAQIRGYTGSLSAADRTPLEFARVTLRGMGKEFSFVSLSGGEFYFENMTERLRTTGNQVEHCGDPSPFQLSVIPGHYTATVEAEGVARTVEIEIPLSMETVVSLGKIVVPDNPDHAEEE